MSNFWPSGRCPKCRDSWNIVALVGPRWHHRLMAQFCQRGHPKREHLDVYCANCDHIGWRETADADAAVSPTPEETKP